MRAVALALAAAALRFSERSAGLGRKVAEFEASTVAYQSSRSDLADAIVADFDASTIAYQKSQSVLDAGNWSDLSAELESAEFELAPRQSDKDFDEDKEVDQEAREGVKAVKSTSLLRARAEANTTHSAHKSHLLATIRAHKRARAHSLVVDLPVVPDQQESCDPGITVCLPCDGANLEDANYIARVLQSIAGQSCLPEKVILAISGISADQSAELLEELPDYKELFALEINSTEEPQNAGMNRNRCARAADTEVISFFDVDDLMHHRRLELLSITFGNYQPKAVVHAYEESPKYDCEAQLKSFDSKTFGDTFQIFDGIGIYDLSMTPNAEANNSLRTPNDRGLNHAGHISVLRSVFSEVQQSNLPRGQDAKFARDILKHFGRKEDTMACLDVPLTLYCHDYTIHWTG
jgi:hypothetical protein